MIQKNIMLRIESMSFSVGFTPILLEEKGGSEKFVGSEGGP